MKSWVVSVVVCNLIWYLEQKSDWRHLIDSLWIWRYLFYVFSCWLLPTWFIKILLVVNNWERLLKQKWCLKAWMGWYMVGISMVNYIWLVGGGSTRAAVCHSGFLPACTGSDSAASVSFYAEFLKQRDYYLVVGIVCVIVCRWKATSVHYTVSVAVVIGTCSRSLLYWNKPFVSNETPFLLNLVDSRQQMWNKNQRRAKKPK